MKPAPVGCCDRVFAELAREFLHVGYDVGLGDDGADDLDEPLHRCRVEEVQPDDASGVRRRGRDLGDRQRRRVGREHGVWTHDVVELGEDAALKVEPLDNSLDDEVAVLQVGQRRREGEAAEDLLLLARR